MAEADVVEGPVGGVTYEAMNKMKLRKDFFSNYIELKIQQ